MAYEVKSEKVYGSAARTVLQTGADIENPYGVGLILVIDITVDPASAVCTFTIQGKDPTSGKYYTILVSAGLAAVATTILRVHPELAVAANLVAKDMMPSIFRVNVAVADGDSMTYSVGATLTK